MTISSPLYSAPTSCSTSMRPTRQDEVRQWIERAAQHQKKGELEQARMLLEEVVRRVDGGLVIPTLLEAQAYRDLATLLIEGKDAQEAERAYCLLIFSAQSFRVAGKIHEAATVRSRAIHLFATQKLENKTGVVAKVVHHLKEAKVAEINSKHHRAEWQATNALQLLKGAKLKRENLKADAFYIRGLARARRGEVSAVYDLSRAARLLKEVDEDRWLIARFFDLKVSHECGLKGRVAKLHKELSAIQGEVSQRFQSRLAVLLLEFHPGKEEDVTDGGGAGEEHDHAVDSNTDSASGGHALADRFKKLVV